MKYLLDVQTDSHTKFRDAGHFRDFDFKLLRVAPPVTFEYTTLKTLIQHVWTW